MVCIIFSLCKDNSVKIVSIINHAHKSFNFITFTHNPEFLINEQRFINNAFFLNDFIVTHKLTSNLKNWFRHCSTKKKNSCIRICLLENCLNIFYKAHIKHLIAFVKNEVINFTNIKSSTFKMILNTAWSTYNNFNTTFQILNLS